MKKVIIKILIICISLFYIIGQINGNTYAYTLEDVKEITDIKTVEENGEPEEYDIAIDASDMKSSEEVPVIETSIDKILYTEKGLFGVDFFGTTIPEDNAGKKVREIVRSVYKILLYIIMAVLFTMLIYIAVIIVSSTISSSRSTKLPMFWRKNRSPQQEVEYKRLIEQWIKMVFSLVLAVFIMNLITALANNLVSMMSDKKVEDSSITVYVKNSMVFDVSDLFKNLNFSNSSGNTTTLNASAEELKQKVIDLAKNGGRMGVPNNYCQRWVRTVYEKAFDKSFNWGYCCAHKAGQNAINLNTNKENIEPGAAVFSYKSSGPVICDGCGQDAGHIGIYVGDGKIANLTGRGETGVSLTSIEDWERSFEFSGWGWLPGTEVMSTGATESTSTSNNGKVVKKIDYYFKTDLGGLMLFQTQYKVSEFLATDITSYIAGWIILIFKFILYGIFFIRMVIIAVLSAFAPIIILVDGLKRINGNRGILGTSFIVYLYTILLRPCIALIYYVLLQDNINLASAHPFYAVAIIILIIILIVISLILLIRRLRHN